MKLGQILISFAISCLIFFGLFMGETVRFDVFNSLQNPFEKTVELEGEVKAGIETKEVFTADGEFFRLYPGSVLDFEKKNREVIDGGVFISSQFITEEDFQKAKTHNEFTENSLPKVGQLKVGPILLNAPGAIVFISRDKEKQRSEIYAYDHAIEIYFPSVKKPFVVPSGMSVNIYESLITTKTGKLYYSKLKKELRLLDFLLGIEVDKDSERIEDRITHSLERLRLLRQEVELYAKNLPQTWLWFRPSSFMGKFSNMLKNLQKDYALGYTNEKKEKRQFEALVANLVDANHEVQSEKRSLATKNVDLFLKKFEGQAWSELMVSNESIKENWLNFERAQKTWLRAIFPDDIANVFFDIWFKIDQSDPFVVLDQKFVSIETLLANTYFNEAEKKLVALKPTIERIKVETDWSEDERDEKKIEITKIRRLLTELQRTKSFFQKKDVFEVYSLMVKKELQLYTSKTMLNELTLEVAQDILFFLHKFLDPETVNSENARTLVKLYNDLEIDKVVEGMGRSIFSEEELSTVDLVAYVGSSGLTKEEIASLRKSKKAEKVLIGRIENLEKQKTEEEKEAEDLATYRQVHDEESLYYFLKTRGVDVSMMKIMELVEGELFRFQDGIIGAKEVSGTFQVSQQTFKIIRVGTRVERRLKLRFFDTFLENLKDSEEEAETVTESKNYIPKNPIHILLERRIVLERLENEGFEAAIQDIEPLNMEGTLLKVEGILLEKRYKLDFVYSQMKGTVQELEVKNGRNVFKFEGEFEMEDLAQTIEAKILERLDEKREAADLDL